MHLATLSAVQQLKCSLYLGDTFWITPMVEKFITMEITDELGGMDCLLA